MSVITNDKSRYLANANKADKPSCTVCNPIKPLYYQSAICADCYSWILNNGKASGLKHD